jgi:NitT/TauT family transport system permease protein
MRIFLTRALMVVVLLLAWEGASGRLVASFFISRPSLIVVAFWGMLADGTLLRHTSVTATEAGLGFLVGGLAGAIVGLALGRSETIDRVCSPFITAFYALPKVALAPLFVMWLGVGFRMKVVFAAVIVFFLVFLNTYTGVRNVSRELVVIFQLMGASERQLISKVIVPSAFTWVFAGLRLSVPYALIGAIVAEMMASNRGLGYLVENSAAQFDTASVFAALIGVVVLALLLNLGVRLSERWLMPWNDPEQRGEIAL